MGAINSMLKVAIYPGTFDPITNGHMDIVKRAKKIFDKVLIAVASSKEKKPMFDLATRVKMAKEAVKEIKGVSVESFDTLLVDFAKTKKIDVIIRGLRAVSDFEYELQMGYANSSLNKDLETIYLMPTLQNAFISSSIVRAILAHKGNAAHLVPDSIVPYLDRVKN